MMGNTMRQTAFKDYTLQETPWLKNSSQGAVRLWKNETVSGVNVKIGSDYFARHVLIEDAKTQMEQQGNVGEYTDFGIWYWDKFWEELNKM